MRRSLRSTVEVIVHSMTWGSADPAAKKIFVFHGYGASAQDLFDLGGIMDPEGQFHWVFAQGPLKVPIGPMMMGYAWFLIDFEAAEAAMRANGGLKYSHLRPPGIDEATDNLLDYLKEANFDPSNDYLAGFSQGSMMAVEVQRRLKTPLKKLLILSGSLVDEAGLATEEGVFTGTQVFQSHGSYDEVLPLTGAEALRDSLHKLGASIEFYSFPGGHEIPMPILQKCSEFLLK